METLRALEREILALDVPELCHTLDPSHGPTLMRYLAALRDEEPEVAEVMALGLKLQLPPLPGSVVEASTRWLEIPERLLTALAQHGIDSIEALGFWGKRDLTGLSNLKRADVVVIEAALQAAGGELRPPQKVLERRWRALLKENGWAAALEGVDKLSARWAFGFLHGLDAEGEVAARLLAHPMTRFLRALKMPVPEAAALEALLEHKPPLQALVIHRHPWWAPDQVRGDLARWLEAFPQLQRLEIYGSDLYLSRAVERPTLRALVVESSHQLPRESLRALLESAPALESLTLKGLADDAIEVLLEFSERLAQMKRVDLRGNHLSAASIKRLYALLPRAGLSDQLPGVPPISDEIPMASVEGLPDLSGLDAVGLLALIEGAPSPAELSLAMEHEAWRTDPKPLLKHARALPVDDPLKGPLLLAAADGGARLKLRAEGEAPRYPWRALEAEDFEVVRPGRLPLRRRDAALERLCAVECFERVMAHGEALPFEAGEYARGYRSSLCEPELFEAWSAEETLDCARREALGRLSEAESELASRRLEHAHEASELYTAHMWEGTEYDETDSERDEVTEALEGFTRFNAGLQALLYASATSALGGALYRAVEILEAHGGDVEAERAWQWRRLLSYLLEPAQLIEGRLARLHPSDPRGYTQGVCWMWAAARRDGDEAAMARAVELSQDPRFAGGRWSLE